MSDLRPIADELHEVLTQEYLLSGELLALIGQERQYLERGDEGGLLASTGRKQQLLTTLQQVTAQRLTLLGSQDGTLPERWTDALDAFPALAQQHANLLELVHTLQNENQHLGLLLNRKAHFITRLLDRLRPDNGEAGLYHSNGNPSYNAGARKLISV